MRPNAMLLFVFLPVAAAALIPVIEKAWRGLADFMANAVAVALLALAIAFVAPVRITGPMTLNFSELFQFSMTFYLDSLSLLMLLVINGIALMALIYSIEYMKEYGGKDRYFALFLLMLAGMNGVVLSHDLFGLYVFLEVAACSSYVLVAFGLKHEELEAAFKYLILAAAASALILLAIALIYARTGNLDMKLASDGINFSIYQGDKAVSFMIVLLIVGFGLKMAMVPFHAWLPDAHPSAPAPISAMLSGVLIKASGVYALMRILYNVFGLHTLPKVGFALMGMGILTIVVAGILALVQTDFKRLLAYSSIGQIGYILLGFGIGTPLALLGALFHLMNHATFKSLLFLNSGAVQQQIHTRDLNKMGGLAKRMPITALTSLVGSLSISGVPPFNGFVSKLIIIVAAIEAGHIFGNHLYYWYAVIAIAFSVVTLAYFLKIQRKAFFGKLSEAVAGAREAKFAMTLPMIILALLCLALSIFFPWLSQNLLSPAANTLTTLFVR